MGAEYLSYVKSIATFAPTFYRYIISVLASVRRAAASAQYAMHQMSPSSLSPLGNRLLQTVLLGLLTHLDFGPFLDPSQIKVDMSQLIMAQGVINL